MSHNTITESATTEQGTVMRLLLGQGFGFLRSDDGTERFIHAKENLEFFNLTIGQRVQYTPVEHVKGKRAINVKPL